MIGLFDSGVGGLTVVREVMRRLPGVSLVYFGDTARTPYGNKSPEVVARYGVEAARFLIGKGADILVIACNTVSSVGLEAIKQEFPHVPVFDVIKPAVKAIAERAGSQKTKVRNNCVGVMGTRALVGSGIYQKLLKEINGFKVVTQAAPLLVPLVEENWLNAPETKRVVKRYLTPFKQAQVGTLVLACTHYPLLKKIISSRVGKKIKIIDPAEETAKELFNWLKVNPSVEKNLKKGESIFYVSDITPHTQDIADKWLGKKVTLEKIVLE